MSRKNFLELRKFSYCIAQAIVPLDKQAKIGNGECFIAQKVGEKTALETCDGTSLENSIFFSHWQIKPRWRWPRDLWILRKRCGNEQIPLLCFQTELSCPPKKGLCKYLWAGRMSSEREITFLLICCIEPHPGRLRPFVKLEQAVSNGY